ncbi:hypothetical protein TUM17377_09290 [Shewanella chilikensis]|jgi:hypothetical protein|nr:hypothetical protein TUM17377_09290 [Shewanella chilikensis]
MTLKHVMSVDLALEGYKFTKMTSKSVKYVDLVSRGGLKGLGLFKV